jgi:DNA-binding CsgD family transcriptional regulator
MTSLHDDQASQDDRLLVMLQRLLGMRAIEARPALDEASTIIAETFDADKVDVFIYQAHRDSLVALGTSKTPLGRRQQALGLDVLSLANGGRAAWSFREGVPYATGHADEDSEELRGLVQGLGIRSVMSHPLDVGGDRLGILQVDSTRPDCFSERDQRALEAVAGWVGLVLHRATLVEHLMAEAERRGSHRAAEEIAKLTRRQQEIAVCIAEGLTNEQIAQRLVLSPGTAANHVEHILRRLGLRSRVQIGVWAVERGLYRSDQQDDEPDKPDDRGRWQGRSVGPASDAERATDDPSA